MIMAWAKEYNNMNKNCPFMKMNLKVGFNNLNECNMTWHDMKNKNTMHGKLNYRDSGDGIVSTRVDTKQVSKIAKGEGMT